MASKPPSIPISQPDFLIAQHEWVTQIHNTRVVIRVCNRCFALYDVKNTKQNCLALPVWYVFSSFRWAGCSTAIARLLARSLTSIICVLVVFVPRLAVLFERPYYTVLYKITLTIVSSIFPRTYFQNYLRQKQKKKVFL